MNSGARRQLADSRSHQATSSATASVVLFDGVCNLCSGFVQFVIARDRARRFRFASLQSDAARRCLETCGVAGSLPDSIVLIEEGGVFTRSAAALRIARRLGFPWSLAVAFAVVPPSLRDFVYDLVARNRYRWFGTRDVCLVPTPELRERFLS